jgi:hypothetical protein
MTHTKRRITPGNRRLRPTLHTSFAYLAFSRASKRSSSYFRIGPRRAERIWLYAELGGPKYGGPKHPIGQDGVRLSPYCASPCTGSAMGPMMAKSMPHSQKPPPCELLFQYNAAHTSEERLPKSRYGGSSKRLTHWQLKSTDHYELCRAGYLFQAFPSPYTN